MDAQIQQARQAGYSDDEIAQYLSQTGVDTSKLNLNTWDNLVSKAQDVAKQENFPPSVMIGQMALESGKGQSQMATAKHNYFGYEAYDSNPDAAKSYDTPESSMKDYVDLIKKDPRYSTAYQQWTQDHNDLGLLQAIKNSGYATDPDYVTKVATTPEFQQFYGVQ